MKLTKSFHQNIDNDNLIIEFEIRGYIEDDEVVFGLPKILSVFSEDSEEEVDLENAEEIVDEYIDKHYKNLAKQISLE